MTFYRKWFSRLNGKLVINLGLTLFVVGVVLKVLIPTGNIPGTESISHWFVRVIRDLGIIITLSTMIVVGIRNLRREGFSFKLAVMPLAGLLLLSGLSVVSFSFSSKMQEIDLSMSQKNECERLNQMALDESIELPTRSKASMFYARLKYQDTGVFVDYMTAEGVLMPYQPSAEEVTMRQEMLRSQQQLKWLRLALRKTGYLYVVVIVGSIFLGFMPLSLNCYNYA